MEVRTRVARIARNVHPYVRVCVCPLRRMAGR